MEVVRLNASALSDPNSLRISLSSSLVSVSFSALVDSGSTHCFVDSAFAQHRNLPVYSINPIELRLIDGSIGSAITQSVDVPVLFSSGESMTISFYVTPLDQSCSVVLGYNWLTRYNPLIDWVLGSITFRPQLLDWSAPPTSSARAAMLPPQVPSVSTETPQSDPASAPRISMIGAAAFVRACKLPGAQSFRIHLSDPSVSGKSASVSDEAPELSHIPEEYHDFADVFSKAKADTLAPHRPYDLKIDLEEGSSPPVGTVYSLSQSEVHSLREFIDEHIRIGFIRPSNSPHGAPVLFVRKKDGSLRLCVDFRGLNKISKKDRYPLPFISDLLSTAGRARIYTTIDLRHAYHLVRIAEGDEWKTAFRTRYGSFEWLVMPFGLSNAPAAFQRFMNDIFSDLLDVHVTIYLDDILVYSDDPAEHTKHVREVLRRLRKHGLYARPDKCRFSSDSVEYLGFILSKDGLKMDPTKVQSIRDWPEPRKIKDIQSFLGFANFYRRFISDYSDIVVPLTRLTRKGTPWNFDDAARKSFEALKSAFTSAPVLTHWVPDRQIVVETDASDYALGAIISIQTDSGEIHPVAFHSRTFSAPELNYDTHDKELLAIFDAFRVWRHFLEGSAIPIDVVTDHKNLEYFSTTKVLTRRQARWSEYLSQFNLVIRFRPGRLGAKPDSLTRRWDVYPKGGDSDYATVNPSNFRPMFTQEQLSVSLRATELLTPVLRATVIMDQEKLNSDILSALPDDPLYVTHLKDPQTRWSVTPDGFLRYDNLIYIPDSDDLRLRILRYKHDHILSGHPGQTKTIDLVRRDYTWPGLREFVKKYVKSCTTCMRAKPQRHKPYGLLKQLPIPERPWNSISMDFIEPLPTSSGCDAILVVVDRFSKQGIFIPTTIHCTSEDLAIIFITHVFSKHGVPEHVTSDRGPEFVSRFFRSLGTALDMRLHFTSGYHPEGDGQTERTNQTLEQYLRIFCNYQQDNWFTLLPLAEFTYNNTPSATTGTSPFFANKGYHPNLTLHPERDIASSRAKDLVVDLDELHQELKSAIAEAQLRYQGPADARRSPAPNFIIGQQAYVKAKFFRSTRPSHKLSEKFLGPFEILAKAGTHSYTLRLPETIRGVHPVFHVSMLEPAVPNEIPNRVQSPPPPVEVAGELEYEIAEVLDSKVDRRRACKLLYLVRWLGYENTDEEFSWLPATELENAKDLTSDFHSAYPGKPGPLPHL